MQMPSMGSIKAKSGTAYCKWQVLALGLPAQPVHGLLHRAGVRF
jgi:hypothetical protein